MNEIKHEGKTYILKDRVEDIISDRLKKYANKSSQYEETIQKLQTSLDEMTSTSGDVNLLREKIEKLESNLHRANSKYERHQAINKHGISSPAIMKLLEWEYENTMESRPKKDRQKLVDWLDGIITDPDSAPETLRPHLPAREINNQESEIESEIETSDPMPGIRNQPPQINLNSGAMRTPIKEPMINQIGNLDYYRQHRETFKNQFKKRRK